MKPQRFLICLLMGLLLGTFVLGGCSKSEKSQTAKEADSDKAKPVAAEPAPEKAAPASQDVDALKAKYAATAFKILDIDERSYDGGSALAVIFSVPLDVRGRPDAHLAVSQKSSGLVEGSWVLSDDGRVAYFPHIDPATEYQVSVYRSLKDINGKGLEQDFAATVKTRDAQKAVGFADRGSVLPAGLSKGLPVVGINVKAVDIDFYRIAPKQIAAFLQQWYAGGQQGAWQIQEWIGQAELVHSGRFDLDAPANQRRTFFIPVLQIRGMDQAGLYAAVMREAGTYPTDYPATYFVVSDLGLHVRRYPDFVEVYLSSIRSAAPVSGVEVSLVAENGDILAAGRTTEEGRAAFSDLPAKALIVLARQQNQIAVVPLRSPALDLSEFDVSGPAQLQQELFIYGPRDLYRPGETVEVAALLRDADGKLLDNLPLSAVFTRPDQVELKAFTWQPEALGFYRYRFALPEGAPTGTWKLAVTTPDQTRHEYAFTVADFMPERMKLDFEAKEGFVAADAAIALPVKASYLYGAPAAGNDLDARVRVKAERFPIAALTGFYFGDAKEANYAESFDLPRQTLDAQGRSDIVVEPRWQAVKSPLAVRVLASVLESGGRPVTRAFTVFTWPAEALVGIRPLFGEEQGQLRADANAKAAFEIVKSDRDGRLIAAASLDVQLIREFRDYYWEYTAGRWETRYSEKHYPVAAEKLSLGQGKRAEIALPVEWGSYRLEVTDPETARVASLRFYAGYSWMAAEVGQGQAMRPDKVEIKLDKAAYKPGDIARVSLAPPHAGQALVTVESDRPLWSARLDLPAEGKMVEIPVSADWNRHDIYITAMVLRPAEAADKRTPNRALGILHLPLDRSQRKLALSLEAPDKVQPGTEVTVTLKAAAPGETALPDTFFVTLAAVDQGVLNITDFATPDPFGWFFAPRRYGGEMRDIYGRVVEQGPGDLARQRFGGDADLSRGGLMPGTKVQIVSLFSGPVKLNEAGQAGLALSLPDFNGRLRLMALAFGQENYGKTEKEMTVAAPIIADVALPRFLAAGDRSTLALDLHNLTEVAQNLDVRLSASGPVSLADGLLALSLAPGEKITRRFTITAGQDFGLSDLTLDLTNGAAAGPQSIVMRRKWTLGVRPAYPALLESRRQVVDPAHPLTVPGKVLDSLMPATVQGRLIIADQPPLDLASHLTKLFDYPYGCLEQTVSRAYPLLFATPQNRGLWGVAGLSEEQRAEALDKTLVRMASMQRANGGFGLWSQDGPEEYWLTAFAVDFLLTARDLGWEVPEKMIAKALERLTEYIRSQDSFFQPAGSDNPAHLTLAVKAFAGYVLSRVNQASLAELRNLLDHHADKARSGLPLAHLAAAFKHQGDHTRSEAAAAKALTLTRSEKEYLGDYGSPIRDDALMIQLLSGLGKPPADLEALLLRLSDQLAERIWLSTQERGSLFLAGLVLAKGKGQAWSVTLRTGSEVRQLSQSGSFAMPLSFGQLQAGVSIEAAQGQSLFAAYEISGYPQTAPEPFAQEIHVTRQFYDTQGHPQKDYKLPAGQLLVAHISVAADRPVPHALLVDLLPAGFELEDPNLAHTIKIDDLLIDGKAVREWKAHSAIAYEGFRDDRYLAAADIRASQAVDLFYLVRAVTPGTYRIPPSYVEDMYRPFIRAVGRSEGQLEVIESHER